jgi:hypothetical protein
MRGKRGWDRRKDRPRNRKVRKGGEGRLEHDRTLTGGTVDQI